MKTYREYLQFIKDNPKKAKEMNNNKNRLIHGLFYPISLELINIPLYSPIIPKKIKELLEENNISLSLDNCIQITKELYTTKWPKSREDIISYLSNLYSLKNTDNFLKYGLDTSNYDYFTLKNELKIYQNQNKEGIPKEVILPNLYVENNISFIKLFSNRLEKELALPMGYVFKTCVENYKEDKGSGFNYISDLDQTKELALARGLYALSFELFRKDKFFIKKLFSYEDILKKVS
tara:strand:+ start:54561 stop:55265 length:705 start_codon:yes stop_codon:yes gene_type:complete